ncbi:zinc finger protein 501-like [Musca vetustissima]|uniref:zinc finger protein 501-like n=1 Tax=Musca vetustissima TaxID=27455 RepID=UPI002AB6B7CB|nr:zinc finger protein 501-like [Musca vetustissima]
MLMPELIFGDNDAPSELMSINKTERMDYSDQHFNHNQNAKAYHAQNVNKPQNKSKPMDMHRSNYTEKQFNKQQLANHAQNVKKSSNNTQNTKSCPGPRPIKCRLCTKISDNIASYRNHFCQKHRGKEFYIYCCGRKYNAPQHYENHINQNRNVAYQCKACHKCFEQEITLVRHTRQCVRYKQGLVQKIASKQFKCQQCKEMFSSEVILRQHVSKFHSDRRHHCTYCEKSYTKSDSLREHMAKHTGNYLYKCDECVQDFTYRSQWRKHMLKFHPQNAK